MPLAWGIFIKKGESMGKQLHLKIRLKLWLDGKMVLDTSRRKKSQILLQLERVPHDQGYIKVSYSSGEVNEAEYYHDSAIKKALSDFTSKELISTLTKQMEQL